MNSCNVVVSRRHGQGGHFVWNCCEVVLCISNKQISGTEYLYIMFKICPAFVGFAPRPSPGLCPWNPLWDLSCSQDFAHPCNLQTNHVFNYTAIIMHINKFQACLIQLAFTFRMHYYFLDLPQNLLWHSQCTQTL